MPSHLCLAVAPAAAQLQHQQLLVPALQVARAAAIMPVHMATLCL
jgi:hypothetical protein